MTKIVVSALGLIRVILSVRLGKVVKHEGKKFFCFTQSSQRSKDAKGLKKRREGFETQRHKDTKARRLQIVGVEDFQPLRENASNLL